MQIGVLTKKLNTYPKEFQYTITREQLRVSMNNVFTIAISLDSEYYVFHKLFKMLDEIEIVYSNSLKN